jgi:hypothetical protein
MPRAAKSPPGGASSASTPARRRGRLRRRPSQMPSRTAVACAPGTVGEASTIVFQNWSSVCRIVRVLSLSGRRPLRGRPTRGAAWSQGEESTDGEKRDSAAVRARRGQHRERCASGECGRPPRMALPTASYRPRRLAVDEEHAVVSAGLQPRGRLRRRARRVARRRSRLATVLHHLPAPARVRSHVVVGHAGSPPDRCRRSAGQRSAAVLRGR